LTLSHNDTGGMSSIVFKSRKDVNDYGYISYQDDYLGDSEEQRGLLAIGIQNDTGGTNVDNIALMPSGFVGINTKIPSTTLDVNGNTKISGSLTVEGSSRLTGNVRIGSIVNVEEAINNAGGVPSITYDEATETTTFGGNFVTVPQLTITPEVAFNNATQEIYSKHGDVNGIAELKLGNDNGTTLTFNNILKSENGKATFYGNDGVGETKYMEYNSTDDKINFFKDTDLGINNLTFNKGVIQEVTGTPATATGGSLTIIHNDYGGTSSIVFKSKRAGTDYGYISYIDDVNGGGGTRSVLELGAKTNPGTSGYVDNIALMPSGYVGINTRIPQATLDVNGDISCNQMTMNNVFIGERTYNKTDGAGIMVKTLDNPSVNVSTAGSIFEVQSQVFSKRLWVGHGLTSSGSNKFMFGFDNTYGQEALESRYKGKLDTDGSVDCTEIKINSIPINAFYNFTFGFNYTPNGTGFGRGNPIRIDPMTFHESYSHFKTFNSVDVESFKCDPDYFGTYEIHANVLYRNNEAIRHNPCIAISINNDAVDGVVNGTNTGPNWDVKLPNGFCQHNIFSTHYVRTNEGRVTNLSASRIYHFTNTTDKVSVDTFIEGSTGDLFQEIVTLGYTIISSGISFKYIGNFNNITTVY